MLPISTQRILIPIHIETLTGTSFELLVSPNEQIQCIKYQIERREGIPISHQHLIWKTTELDDQSCLNDYQIDSHTTLKLVLAIRGGPINTKRIPIEDNFLNDMSEYIDNSQDDLSSNKNVTFLVLRDGEQFNFFQVIDRGDGTLSPLSGSISATSMYNTVEQERESDEKRQDDDRKTKQKMDSIRAKLKNPTKKDILRPTSSSSKPIPAPRYIPRDTSSYGNHSSLDQYHTQSYSYSSNLFNTYNFLSSATTKNDLLLAEEDSEDEEDDDDNDDDDNESDDDVDDDDNHIEQKSRFTSRSYSPSIFRQNNSTTRNTKPVLIDCIPHLSSINDQISTPKKLTTNNNNAQTSNQTYNHQNSPTTTTTTTTLPQIIKKPSIAKQQTPLSLSKYRHLSLQTSNEYVHNENLMLNKPIDLLKTPGKQSPLNPTIPPPPPSKRQTINPIDNTKVTIETIGPQRVSALLRQNATIEPVDTSRGVGKHLVSLLTTASKEPTSIKTNYKQSNSDVVIEENYKFGSKLTNPWTNNNNSTKLPPVILNRKSTTKCFLCKKKTGLATTYQCRCGSTFCSEHRYPEAHACAFDYKAEGKRLIERNNPLITAPKLPKI